MPGPPEPSDPVGATASDAGSCEPFALTDGLADGAAVALAELEALGEGEALRDGETAAVLPVVGRAAEVGVDPFGATVVRGPAVVGRGAVVRGVGFGVAFTVGPGVGLGALVAVFAGGAERGFCPEPNRNPTTVPGFGS